MIPGVEERLVNGSEENATHIAELVGFPMAIEYISIPDDDAFRSRKAPQVPDPMTLRA
jgi:hypothetical protein